MNLRSIITCALLGLLPSCMTTSLSLPPAKPKQGMAVIKGGTLFMAPVMAQYTYVVGMDGVLFPSWTGSKDILPGKHKFVFGASHAAGIKSYVETTLNIKEGCQYLVEIKNSREPGAVYGIYEMPERKEIQQVSGPLVYTSEYGAGDTMKSLLIAKGWKTP